MKKNRSTIVLSIIFLIGLAVLLYPTASDYWNQFHQTRVIEDYSSVVEEVDTEAYEKMLDEARAYNATLTEKNSQYSMTEENVKDYERMLDLDGTGIMGVIEIPRINVKLPIYHGTDDSVLAFAVGHLNWSSLPTGGPGTHIVLSGHTGLPTAKLFTDLDRLKEGDTFTITVLNEVLTYQVDQIEVVEPTDTDSLLIEDGKDYCSLVTCTPYGINSHRLLVRGVRVPTPEEPVKPTVAERVERFTMTPQFILAGGGGLGILILILLLLPVKKKQKK